jgi:hypothetical protein
MPAHPRNRAASPPAAKVKNPPASTGDSSTGLESNQVVMWAVYCCIAIAVVVVGSYAFGRPMLVRAFPDNTADATANAAVLESQKLLTSIKAAYDNAVDKYRAAPFLHYFL